MAGFALLRACLLSTKRCCYFDSVPVIRGKGPTTPSEQNVFYRNARRRLMFLSEACPSSSGAKICLCW